MMNDLSKNSKSLEVNILQKLQSLETEATAFGFKWENPQQIMAQIRSELTEIEVHLKDQDKNKLQEEIGDLLHAAFSLCVFCQFNANETLTQSVNKFETRFRALEQLSKQEGLDNLQGLTFAELMSLWEKAKQMTKQKNHY